MHWAVRGEQRIRIAPRNPRCAAGNTFAGEIYSCGKKNEEKPVTDYCTGYRNSENPENQPGHPVSQGRVIHVLRGQHCPGGALLLQQAVSVVS